jgi:hypothetical protein
MDSTLTRLVSAQATPENVVPKSMPTHNLRSFSERPAKVETMVRSADSNQSLEFLMVSLYRDYSFYWNYEEDGGGMSK